MTSHPARRRSRAALAAVAVPAVVCGMFAIAAPAQAADGDPVQQPKFENGLSQAVYSTDRASWINEEFWVESEVDSDLDGKPDLVHIDVSRVAETDQGLRVPVVMEMSPYYAGGSGVDNWSVDHELGAPPTSKDPAPAPNVRSTSPQISTSLESAWVPRGFAVVHAESLGSGWSEGCPTSGGRNESLGGKAVIDWLNGRTKAYTSPDRSQEAAAADWATGSVGMTGTSYNGTLPIGVASTGVEGLDAIVPVSAISDWYNYYRANGAVRAPGGYQGEDLDVLADYVHTRTPLSTCQPVIENLRANQDRATGDRSDFWKERDYLADGDKITAATLVAHGQEDWNVMTKNAVDLYEVLKSNGTPHQFYFHQGRHGGAPSDVMMNRWFTKYLYKQNNGVERLPKAYVVREDKSTLAEYAEWPVPGSADTTLRFGAASKANTVGELSFGTDSSGKTEMLIDDASKRAADLAAAAQSQNRLVYKSDALTEAVHISGATSLSLNLAVDDTAANLTGMLVQYNADGTQKIITRGWMDVQNRESDEYTTPIQPGVFEQYAFELEPKDTIVPAGAKLGVVVLSSDYEYTIRPEAGTKLSVNPAKSSVTLPVVGGTASLAAALADDAADGEGQQIITAEVEAGGLTMAVSSADPVVLEGVTLSGRDLSTTGALHPVNVLDSRGTASGWDLTAQVSDFTSENGVILGQNLGWTPNAKTAASDLVSTSSSSVTAGDAVAPGVGIADGAGLCTADEGESSGAFECGADLELGIPGSTKAGTYSAVLTLTLI